MKAQVRARPRPSSLRRQGDCPAGGDESTIEIVANRSRWCGRPGHRFRRTHPSALARILQATAPPLAGKEGRRPAPYRRRRRCAHLWRTAGRLRFRPRDLSRRESGAPDGPATPSPRTRARGIAGPPTRRGRRRSGRPRRPPRCWRGARRTSPTLPRRAFVSARVRRTNAVVVTLCPDSGRAEQQPGHRHRGSCSL